MLRMRRSFLLPMLAFILALAACTRSGHDPKAQPAQAAAARAGTPVIPAGFDPGLLDILRCPEDLTKLRLATSEELSDLLRRRESGTLRLWSGAAVAESFDGLLIREDGKIGYRIKDGVPVLLIDEALVIDASIEPPAPGSHRPTKK